MLLQDIDVDKEGNNRALHRPRQTYKGLWGDSAEKESGEKRVNGRTFPIYC